MFTNFLKFFENKQMKHKVNLSITGDDVGLFERFNHCEAFDGDPLVPGGEYLNVAMRFR